MLFGKLLPREDNFFALFNQHADHIVAAANAFSELIRNYSDLRLRDQFTQAVDEAESSADHVYEAVSKALHETFITPIDREQIHQLVSCMDDVADCIQDAAESLTMYDVQVITPSVSQFSDLNQRCCERVRIAVRLLEFIANQKECATALKTCEEIHQLESDADRVLRSAMSSLFREEKDLRELIKLKAIYESMELISDRCQDVAKRIEAVVLENS